MGTLDRYLHFRLPSGGAGDVSPLTGDGDNGDTPDKPKEDLDLFVARGRVSAGDNGDHQKQCEMPSQAPAEGGAGNSTPSPVVTIVAGAFTPSGDTQSQAGSGFEGLVANVAVASGGGTGAGLGGDTQSQAGSGLQPFVADVANRPMRVVWHGWSEQATRAERDCLIDLVEWRARQNEAPDPCGCGDTLFWRIAPGAPWRCRTCDRPNARLRVQWLPAGGGPAARAAARKCDAPDCRKPASAWSSDGAAWCAAHGREWLQRQP